VKNLPFALKNILFAKLKIPKNQKIKAIIGNNSC